MTATLLPLYVVITPAFNEEKYIGMAIAAMTRQSIKPIQWIIVDDGSSDGTAKIIKKAESEYNWIKYIYNKKKFDATYYASNVYAIQKGIEQAKNIPYTFLAILDADIELCDDYYERIFDKFSKYQDLGITTGTYLEREAGTWKKAKIDRRSTPKAIQVFRRECYETAGGYIPFKHGGEDSGMEIMARMHGWKTWSFENIVVKHHRPVGTGDGKSILQARFRQGITDYCLGTHPFFMLLKSFKRMLWEKPYFFSGAARLLGFLYGCIKKFERQLSNRVITYLQKEQMQRIFKPHINNWEFE